MRVSRCWVTSGANCFSSEFHTFAYLPASAVFFTERGGLGEYGFGREPFLQSVFDGVPNDFVALILKSFGTLGHGGRDTFGDQPRQRREA